MSDGPEQMATRNPPVNQNPTTTSPANTAGAVNVAPAGGSGAGATGTNQAPVGGQPSWESGVGTAAPTLTTVAPTTFALASAPVTVTCTGTGFLPTSVMVLGGVAQETTYNSGTQVTASVAGTGQVVGATTATVNNGPTASGTRPFTWT